VKSPNGNKNCEGYVKVEKLSNNLEYTAYLDCGKGDNLLVSSSYINYGGNYLDEFNEVIKTSDNGYIAVGRSNSTNYSGNSGKGAAMNYDAIIVKYNSEGIEEWSRNFGGSKQDQFYGVTEDKNGYVVVGDSVSQDGDLSDLETGQHNSGNIVLKKILFLYNGIQHSYAASIIYQGNNYYIGGSSRGIDTQAPKIYFSKYDSNFNQLFVNSYGGTNYDSSGGKIIKNNQNNIVIVGTSGSNNNEMSDIKIGPLGNYDAAIFVANDANGGIIEKGIFGGASANDSFAHAVEVDDGYIAVGYSGSSDHHMEGLYKGGNDAVVVKYSKTAVSGILPIVWKKVIGGSNDDRFSKVILNNNELTIFGYTNSIDGDIEGIRKVTNEYYDGLIVKMDLAGNILSKQTYGGSKSDFLISGLYNINKYVTVGRSFSTDSDIEPFNFGNSDAIMATLDNNLIPIKNFQLQTLLLSKQKEITKNYGTSIPLPVNKGNFKLYTTNDATKDLGVWCTTNNFLDVNSNYNAINCLLPFDDGDIKRLYFGSINYVNSVIINPNSNNNWLRIYYNFGSAGSGEEVNNLYLWFANEGAVTIQEAANLGYIENLVISGGLTTGNYFFTNSFNILSGGSTGPGVVPSLHILIKPKNKKLERITYNSARAPLITQARMEVHEFNNFDISIIPTS